MPRQRAARVLSTATGLTLTVGISFAIVIALILLISKMPGKAIYYFFVGPFTNAYYLGNMLDEAVGLIFTGLGIAVAFSSSTFKASPTLAMIRLFA